MFINYPPCGPYTCVCVEQYPSQTSERAEFALTWTVTPLSTHVHTQLNPIAVAIAPSKWNYVDWRRIVFSVSFFQLYPDVNPRRVLRRP
ncbi:hypothetical protein TNCV_3437381 [Trichonephila clavipes]|nr:hypothetical protein TNCV_3437381 [Trichonephila clavipes]